MAETAPAPEAKPKKSNKMLFIIIAAVVVLGGVGGGYFFMSKKSAANAKEETSKKSKDKRSDDEEPGPSKGSGDEKDAKTDKAADGKFMLELPDDKGVKKVIGLEPFVVNLVDASEPRYLRMSVSIGIGETKEEKTDPLLTTRVRNAILAVLTTKSSAEVLTPEGKSQLRKELLKAARKSVEEPRIEAIYITDFIIQM